MSYALVVLMDGLITEMESVDTTLVVVDFDTYDNDPDSASVSPEEAVDKVRSFPTTGPMGAARERVLLSLADHIGPDAPICTFCTLPTGSGGKLVEGDAQTWCCCADCSVDPAAAALGRKVAEALEAGGVELLGETERLIIYRVLRDAFANRSTDDR